MHNGQHPQEKKTFMEMKTQAKFIRIEAKSFHVSSVEKQCSEESEPSRPWHHQKSEPQKLLMSRSEIRNFAYFEAKNSDVNVRTSVQLETLITIDLEKRKL